MNQIDDGADRALPVASANEVWRATLDGKFNVSVTRIDPSLGTLAIRRSGDVTPFATKLVTFSYSAVFGPDVADVADWQDWAIKQVEAVACDAPTHPQGGHNEGTH